MNSSTSSLSQPQWSSQLVFCMAAIGSAVGLGNIWRFPYIAGEFGGGVFVLTYILCVVFLLPVMTGEILLGRRGRRSPVGSIRRIVRDFNLTPKWGIIGWLCIIGSALILSFYSVIAGAILAYWVRSMGFMFVQITPDGIAHIYESFIKDPEKLLFWHTIFMLSVAIAVGAGVRSGIERSLKYLMPLFFFLLVFLVFYSIFYGSFSESIDFLFSFDLNDFKPQVIMYALGQAFFSLSLAYGAIMMYGAYLPKNANIVGNSIVISVVDTLVAILAAIFVFSIVFKYDLQPAQGFSLVFKVIPLALGEMETFGYGVGFLFFGLLTVAAWTSAVSLLEPVVVWALETFDLHRIIATIVVSLVIWIIGFGTIFSFTHPEVWSINSITFFASLDFVNNVLLPVTGTLMALLIGWKLPAIVLREELHILTPGLHKLWCFALRYACPFLIVTVLVGSLLPDSK